MIRNKIYERFLDYISAPPRCLFCGKESGTRNQPFCKKCFDYYLAKLSEPCPMCYNESHTCDCIKAKYIDKVSYMFLYGGKRLTHLAYLIKRSATRFEMYYIADQMANRILECYSYSLPFTCVTYVPRSKKDIRYYGYDHIGLLATVVAEKLGLPCVSFIAHTGMTGEQKRLTREERKFAVKGRYRFNSEVFPKGNPPYGAVLLLDDVMTSGATLEACAKLIKDSGVRNIYAAVISVAGYANE